MNERQRKQVVAVKPIPKVAVLANRGSKGKPMVHETDDDDCVVVGERKGGLEVHRGLAVALPAHSSLRHHRQALPGSGNAALAAYGRILLNPFSAWDHPAKLPQRVNAATTVFTVRQSYTIVGIENTDDGAYDACVLLRGGIRNYIAGTGLITTFATAPGNGHEYIYAWDNDGTNVTPSYDPASTSTMDRYPTGDYDLRLLEFDSIPTWGSVSTAFAAYRKVCGAMRVRYIGPRLEAQGAIALAVVPGDFTVAGAKVISPLVMGAGLGQGNLPLNFESVSALLGAQVSDVLADGVVTWAPQGDGIDNWRPMRYLPVGKGADGTLSPTDVPTNVSGILGTGATQYCEPCDGDPGEFKAFADMVSQPPMAATLHALAPAPGGSQGKLGQTVVQVLKSLNNIHDSNDPMLIMFARNIPANGRFLVDTTFTYEAISDTRAFSAVAPATAARDRGVSTIRAIAADVPRVTYGGPSVIAKIANGVATAVNAGKALARGVQEALPVASDALRAMGLPMEAELVTGIAEGGGALADGLATLALAAV